MPISFPNLRMMQGGRGGSTSGGGGYLQPTSYSPALGGKPANIAMPPNRYEQIQSIYGNLPDLTRTAGDLIGAKMEGLFTPETRRGIANEAAMRGWSSGMPGAQVWENMYMGNIIGAKEQMMKEGLAEFNAWSANLAQMMDDPALKAQIDYWNSTINAAPEPQAAFDRMMAAMKDLMNTTNTVPNTPVLGGLASSNLGSFGMGGGRGATTTPGAYEAPMIGGGPTGIYSNAYTPSTAWQSPVGAGQSFVPPNQMWDTSVGYALGDYNYNPYALDTSAPAFTGSTVPTGAAYTSPSGYYNFGLPTNESDYSSFNILSPTSTSNFGLPGFNDFTPVSGTSTQSPMSFTEMMYGVPEDEWSYWTGE